MKYVVSFVSGVFVGAAFALLFAPASGEELRAQIREGAEVELRKAETEWKKAVAELSAKVDETRQEVSSLVEQAKGQKAKTEAEPAA